MNLHSGSMLQSGRYCIESVLGQGGFGITYLAVQTGLGRKVAIKEFFMKELCNRDANTSQVSVGSVGSRDIVERFRQKFIKEAQNMAKLRHNNIVSVIDVFEENGTAYYVMEYIPGGSLAIKVKSGPLPVNDALRYIRQIASALELVHSRRMMHLDVKPGNILLDDDGNAVLIDFGLSKQYDSAGMQTSTTPVGISHGYAPMEQYRRGGVSEFSPTVDIYSLGATFYKLVTGITPPDAGDIVNEGVPELPATMPSSVSTAITAAMQPRRVDRPQSIGAFLSLLDAKSNVATSIPSELMSKNKTGNDNAEQHSNAYDSEETRSCEKGTSGEILFEDSEVTLLADGEQKGRPFPLHHFKVGNVAFSMVAVQGGSFQMGNTGDSKDADGDEYPVHHVTLSDYCIGETLVTQELWQAVMNNYPSHFSGDMMPVENVSYDDCQAFIRRLNSILAKQLPTGRLFRLPTEAEWEFAARGGIYSRGFRYCGGSSLGDVAWFWNNADCKTHPVKMKAPNEIGLYDMSGNLWEWCQDWYAYGYYSNSPKENPQGAASGIYRVLRGGSWGLNSRYCRVSHRNCNKPEVRCNYMGFRLAF
ncbi:MAG: SUMF1/EgtB/PvdO family nonheme iron enzyme [Bacteroidaceae bacterium]|nr:SUMF1/EgtB/PvdO family nonheme iron enzyme [Bacteroidaceae bacterium]